jgi:L-lactate dehydrogenase (cytochrome)
MALHSSQVVNIGDLRRLAKRRLPRVVFDYIDGGAEAERTLRDNLTAFDRVTLRPRGAVAVPSVDLRTTVLGQTFELPFLLAPVGSSRLFYPRGEESAAAAAGDAGTGYILSTLSGCRLEDVKAATKHAAWYQVYLVGGREVAERAIARARDAGFAALVLTVDTPVSGLRERDVRNGTTAHASVGPALAQSVVTWRDLDWIRRLWPGPIAVKGILTGDDARRAADSGANAVVVSNHGGRQLDGVSASLRALPEVVAAAGTRVEVLMDGGVRRGSDIVKAMCLGAKAVLVGRAYAYGLGAAGKPGVARAIEILRTDLERTLALLGVPGIDALNEAFLEKSDG